MSETKCDKGLAPKRAAKLTAKQERFAQLIALDGINQSDAYRRAYNVGAETSNSTINDNAYTLAHHTDIAPRIAELRAQIQERALCSAEEIIQELKQVGMAAVTGDVRPSDKVAALDKMAKILGLYRDPEKDRDAQAVQITKVTVVLDQGHG